MKRFFAASILVLAFAGTSAIAPAAPDASMAMPQPKVRPLGIPAGYTLVSPCVAGMGEHWVNLSNMNAPIYGSWHGKAVFSEIMVPLQQLEEGFSYANLHALPGFTINHVDFKFEPKGHAGMPVPHYDLHAYYVSAAEQAAICPDGIPDPAMKPTNQ